MITSIPTGMMAVQKQILHDILEAYHPPLKCCHPMEEGFVGLTVYVAAAKEVFKV